VKEDAKFIYLFYEYSLFVYFYFQGPFKDNNCLRFPC